MPVVFSNKPWIPNTNADEFLQNFNQLVHSFLRKILLNGNSERIWAITYIFGEIVKHTVHRRFEGLSDTKDKYIN